MTNERIHICNNILDNALKETSKYKQVFTPELVVELDQLNRDYPRAYNWRELIKISTLDEILKEFKDIDNYLAGNEGAFNKSASDSYIHQALFKVGNWDFEAWASHVVSELGARELLIDTEEQQEQCVAVFEFGTCAIYKHLRTDRISRIRKRTPGDSWYEKPCIKQ